MKPEQLLPIAQIVYDNAYYSPLWKEVQYSDDYHDHERFNSTDPTFLQALCFELKISVTWEFEANYWVVGKVNCYSAACDTQDEISQEILECAAAILEVSDDIYD